MLDGIKRWIDPRQAGTWWVHVVGHTAAMRCLFVCLLLLPVIVPAEQLDGSALLDAVLRINAIQEPELDADAVRQRIDELVEACRARIPSDADAEQTIAALNQVLLTDREVTYLSNRYWRDATLVAAAMRGACNCLGGSILYVVVARHLELPIRMVLVPRHALVRWQDGGTRINIETTAGGVAVPDYHYLSGASSSHLADLQLLGLNRSLSDDEFLAELRSIAAGHLRGQGRLEEACELMRAVVDALPQRDDHRLDWLTMQADLSGDRAAYRAGLSSMAQRTQAPSIATRVHLALAAEYAAEGAFDQEREQLLQALRSTPKNMLAQVLTRLAFCHRSLQDWRGARRYMELALTLVDPGSPVLAMQLYNLAILQKNDADLSAALASIDRALAINPESWNLQVLKAGYLVLDGRRQEGLDRFATVAKPRADEAFWNDMQAWFYAVSEQRERFYEAFEHALRTADNPQILTWIAQDVDLDVYRDEEPFQRLLSVHRERLLGIAAPESIP